jgi:hypothetical protein
MDNLNVGGAGFARISFFLAMTFLRVFRRMVDMQKFMNCPFLVDFEFSELLGTLISEKLFNPKFVITFNHVINVLTMLSDPFPIKIFTTNLRV